MMSSSPGLREGRLGTEKPAGFLLARWRGEAPLSILFWRDMIVVGSLINLATGLAALLLLGLKASTAVWLTVYLLPLPYNLFLVAAVWRTAARQFPGHAAAAQLGALAWVVLATLL